MAVRRFYATTSLSWVTFLLAKQKNVTSCRAIPGEVDFDVGYRCARPNLLAARHPQAKMFQHPLSPTLSHKGRGSR